MFTSLVTCSVCGHSFETVEKNVSVCAHCSYRTHQASKYVTRLEKRFTLEKDNIRVVFYPERDMYRTPLMDTVVCISTLRHIYKEYVRDGYKLV